jgi:uncharacterized protein YlxW (UPF0749 family)
MAMAAGVGVKGRAWLELVARERRVGVTAWTMVALLGWAAAAAAYGYALSERRAAERMASFAALTPVSGPGVEIFLADSGAALPASENPSLALVQDSDLILLDMMLWYGGADAVAISGVRVTARSTITSAGPTILVDGHRLTAPFDVTAVGDPKLLASVLSTRGGFVDRMRSNGLSVRVTERPALTVPAAAMAAPDAGSGPWQP